MALVPYTQENAPLLSPDESSKWYTCNGAEKVTFSCGRYASRVGKGENLSREPTNEPARHFRYVTTLPQSSVICASYQPGTPQGGLGHDIDTLNAPSPIHDHQGDESYASTSASTPLNHVHSPSPTKPVPYLTPHMSDTQYPPQSSQLYRTLTPDSRYLGYDRNSITSHNSNKSLAASVLSLPRSNHGVVLSQVQRANSPAPGSIRRPASANSNAHTHRPKSRGCEASPMKVSRAPTPVPEIITATPAGVQPTDDSDDDGRPHSPQQYQERMVAPMSPDTIQRYNRNIVVPTTHTYVLVEPLKFSFDDGPLPDGWTCHTHPEGARFFHHTEKRIYTDADMYDSEEATVINESADQLIGDLTNRAHDEGITLPPDYELALETLDYDGERICGYYFVDNKTRTLFWLDEFDAEGMCDSIKVVVSLTHLRCKIESQYWVHWELFPNNREITLAIVEEVRDITIHASADVLTSNTSTAMWNTEQNRIALNILNDIKLISGKRNGYVPCVIGRMMRNFTHNQFIHLHGQKGARLDRDQSVHGKMVNSHSLLIKLCSPVLFWAPDTHLETLEKIWVDSIVHETPWGIFINKLNEEWQSFIVIGTVLLNANLAFLSIQSVDLGGVTGQADIHRSAAQIASYVSIFTSLGSVLVALLLVRQNRSKLTAADAANFLQSMTHANRGFETLAILYALPYALLMWSTLAFLLAFTFACYSYSTLTTRIPVSVILLVIGILTIWCIIVSWDGTDIKLLPTWLSNLSLSSELKSSEAPHKLRQRWWTRWRPSTDSSTMCSESQGQVDNLNDCDQPSEKEKRKFSWVPNISLRRATGDLLAESSYNEKV